MTCKDCVHYDVKNSYLGTGYCAMWDNFSEDDDTCEEFEEGDIK